MILGIQTLHHYQIYLNVPSVLLAGVEAPLAWRRGYETTIAKAWMEWGEVLTRAVMSKQDAIPF